MIKNPFDLISYEEILWEIKPDIIIEIGSAHGGFALWLADRMKNINLHAKIVSVDLEDNAKKNLAAFKLKNIVCLVGDCNSQRIVDDIKSIIKPKDSVLLIEDSSHTYSNTLAVLNNYKEIVSIHSYLIIEDGICDVLHIGDIPGPMKAVEDWIEKNPNYQIDREQEKYIMTYNPKGYLKRIS